MPNNLDLSISSLMIPDRGSMYHGDSQNSEQQDNVDQSHPVGSHQM